MLSATAQLARSALEAAPDAMLIVDAAGIVRFANGQACTLFGYLRDELVGLSVEQLMPESYRARHLARRQSYLQSPRLRPMGQGLTLEGQRRDGSCFPVEISLSPVRDGERTLVAAAIRDVTERKRVERELLHARESAERAREAADRANKAKSRFLATASHDLRQPLQTLALLGGALRRTVSEPEAAAALVQQEQAISAMSRLLNALLDVSKLESGAVKPELTDFAVAGLFEVLRREFAPLAANKGLVLETEGGSERVYSDPALIEQIMKNLVSNAIKYTSRGRVVLRAAAQGSLVRLEVQDTGIGIPPDQIGLICDEFYQVGVSTNSSRDGYGLGLSIVQRLAQLLGLRLEVESEVGRGSLFAICVPPGSASRGSGRVTGPVWLPQAHERTASPVVLLVEDDRAVRDATSMLLRVEGYRVTAVASLAEALARVATDGAPDLLITDYHLRGGELGTQVITALRERCGVDLGVVLVTGDTSREFMELDRDQRLRVASKPINAEELLAVLGALLAS